MRLGVWTNKAVDVMRLASESLAAQLAPDMAKACDHWRQAVDIQDHLIYDEPPAWYYPVRESLGGCLLRAGKTAEATQVFREGVRRSPRNGRMLFGLWQSLKLEGDTYQAESVRREFEAAWSGADVTLRRGRFVRAAAAESCSRERRLPAACAKPFSS